MKLVELFDKTVPWHKTKDDSDEKEYEFQVGDEYYIVSFAESEYNGGIWDIQFAKFAKLYQHPTGIIPMNSDDVGYTKQFDITQTGNEFIVFSTVLEIIKEFIREEKPEAFSFEAEEPSRIKLYDALAKRLTKFVTNLGYKINTNKSAGLPSEYHFEKVAK